jgi:cyclohexa-1,5-dienecarbonyl-CoA hydratase
MRYEVREDIACLSLNAPPLNILTAALMRQLTALVRQAQQDSTLKGVALTSAAKVFSAGADVGEHQPERAREMIEAFSGLFGALGALDLPVVMAVDGAALGAGLELAMMADILLASERATFGQPEIRLGFFAPVGVAWLPARVGLGRALEVTCTGRTFSAAEMQTMGLVSRVVAPEQLAQTMEAVLDDLRRASPVIMRMNVRLSRQLAGQPFEAARRRAERCFLEELLATEDVREGIASFVEKRRPVWKNR